MDLFLMDLILRGWVPEKTRVLDAGCGSGRNLIYFLHRAYDLHAIDNNPVEVRTTNFISTQLGKGSICRQVEVSDLPFEDQSFDFVICSRVLHFATDQRHFLKSLNELRRVLSPTGTLYLSMDSAIGLEPFIEPEADGRSRFPDGTVRFLLTKELLDTIDFEWNKRLSHRTVLFDQKHGETTLVLQKAY